LQYKEEVDDDDAMAVTISADVWALPATAPTTLRRLRARQRADAKLGKNGSGAFYLIDNYPRGSANKTNNGIFMQSRIQAISL